jgi:hypothetical protein
MIQTVTIPSTYGPVKLQLFGCENCGRLVQEEHMVNWLEVKYTGVLQATQGNPSPSDSMHYCSMKCIGEGL